MHIVYFDIDGTLAIGKNVPPSAQEALRQLRANGDLVFICTGRNPSYAQKNFAQYADGFICCNGRLAVMGEKILYDHPMEKEQIKEIIALLDSVGAGYVFLETEAGWYGGAEEGFEALASVQDPGFVKKGIDPENIHPYSFDVWFRDLDMRHAIERVLDGICLLNPHGPHPSADMTVLGIDKGTALVSVAEVLGVNIRDTYAFGDGVNDICMIEAAGHGIAMGNGVNRVKEKAEFVTTEILDDGVMNGLKHYGLI